MKEEILKDVLKKQSKLYKKEDEQNAFMKGVEYGMAKVVRLMFLNANSVDETSFKKEFVDFGSWNGQGKEPKFLVEKFIEEILLGQNENLASFLIENLDR